MMNALFDHSKFRDEIEFAYDVTAAWLDVCERNGDRSAAAQARGWLRDLRAMIDEIERRRRADDEAERVELATIEALLMEGEDVEMFVDRALAELIEKRRAA